MRKTLKIMFVLLVVLLLASACSQNKEDSKNETEKMEEKDSTPVAVEPKEPEESQKVYPLTGLPAGDDAINHRVLAVMVNNHALARPQSGLYKADIVYEILTEARITRFLAIFQSQEPEVIGPVRSARHYFVNLSQGYGAIYIAHGWSPQAENLLKNGDIDYLQGLYYDGTLFQRASFRKAPHNSYIPYENAIKGAKDNGYPLTQDVKPLPFLKTDEVKDITGETVNQATIQYASDNVVSYVYHSDDHLYYRHINGEQAEDLETKTPITAANVFIVSADHSYINNDYYRRDIDIEKGGDAYLLQEGKVQKLQWKNVEGRLLPFKEDKEVKFVPGQTWINIVENDPGLDELVTLSEEE